VGVSQVLLDAHALGDVADEAGEFGRFVRARPCDRELNGELAPVRTHGCYLDAAVENRRLARGKVAGEAGAVLVAVLRRDDQVDQLLPERDARAVSERLLGDSIQVRDAAVLVNADRAVERRVEDRG
jgi:hypothetical protein